MNLIALLATLLVAALAWFWLQRQYRAKGRAHFAYLLLFGLSIVAVGLAALGKLHWLGAIIAVTAAGLWRVGMLGARWLLPRMGWLPFVRRYWQRHRQHDQRAGDRDERPSTAPGADAMDRRQALDILGIEEGASREQIIQAHRQLMQKVHPDRGGNDYLASRVNRAKDFLLES